VVDKLAIWNQVQETDPHYTKQFSRGGGFRGTSINAVYLARKATERWGPMGIGWGIEIVDEAIMDGAPIPDTTICEQIHKLRVKLWYVEGGERGEVIQFGQTTFVGKNKYGPFTDEEAPKKSLTDGMTKCLSLLGFSADVFMGRYDDNKYVNDLRNKYEADGPQAANRNTRAPNAKPSPASQAPKMNKASLLTWQKQIAEKTSGKELLQLIKEINLLSASDRSVVMPFAAERMGDLSLTAIEDAVDEDLTKIAEHAEQWPHYSTHQRDILRKTIAERKQQLAAI